ncbi:uncharacterized protein LOC132560525 [Ylistrum balloti]|uniref:uncharacterized protein LOC132560525 n=1 Tax=Ylistrum balloti TaxID=509963 RepID=UPI002905AA75|nr:uncharacterized protein LOC132560525 [Ylistrum balloti]XP_060081176.1 uncharacterized protein LOC132560525 [Ylistrum balloti]
MYLIMLLILSVFPIPSDMLVLTSSSNCTNLGFPGAVPHINDTAFLKGHGNCCIPRREHGGFMELCLKNGEKDTWHACPEGTYNPYNISSEHVFNLDELSSKELCKPYASLPPKEGGKDKTETRLNLSEEGTSGFNSSLVTRVTKQRSSISSTNIDISEVEPNITCLEVFATPGDERAFLNCTVTSLNISCKKVVLKSASGTQVFEYGKQLPDGYHLSCMKSERNEVQIGLEIPGITDEHLEDAFFIKVTTINGDFQKEIKIERSPNSNHGQTLTATDIVPFAVTLISIIIIKMT